MLGPVTSLFGDVKFRKLLDIQWRPLSIFNNNQAIGVWVRDRAQEGDESQSFREELFVGGALLQTPQREGFQQGVGRGVVVRKIPRLSKQASGGRETSRRWRQLVEMG